MKIKLRGKIWEQITQAEHRKLEGSHSAIFFDTYYNEITYFKEITIKKKEKKK